MIGRRRCRGLTGAVITLAVNPTPPPARPSRRRGRACALPGMTNDSARRAAAPSRRRSPRRRDRMRTRVVRGIPLPTARTRRRELRQATPATLSHRHTPRRRTELAGYAGSGPTCIFRFLGPLQFSVPVDTSWLPYGHRSHDAGVRSFGSLAIRSRSASALTRCARPGRAGPQPAAGWSGVGGPVGAIAHRPQGTLRSGGSRSLCGRRSGLPRAGDVRPRRRDIVARCCSGR